jgi:hypothetical protein
MECPMVSLNLCEILSGSTLRVPGRAEPLYGRLTNILHTVLKEHTGYGEAGGVFLPSIRMVVFEICLDYDATDKTSEIGNSQHLDLVA